MKLIVIHPVRIAIYQNRHFSFVDTDIATKVDDIIRVHRDLKE
ncbi:hypothetical protein [Vibrio caribbeanicus]